MSRRLQVRARPPARRLAARHPAGARTTRRVRVVLPPAAWQARADLFPTQTGA